MWKSHDIYNHLDVGNLPVEDSLSLRFLLCLLQLLLYIAPLFSQDKASHRYVLQPDHVVINCR